MAVSRKSLLRLLHARHHMAEQQIAPAFAACPPSM